MNAYMNLLGCAEKVRPARAVDISRIVAPLEVVLAARVRVGRVFFVQHVPDAEPVIFRFTCRLAGLYEAEEMRRRL